MMKERVMLARNFTPHIPTHWGAYKDNIAPGYDDTLRIKGSDTTPLTSRRNIQQRMIAPGWCEGNNVAKDRTEQYGVQCTMQLRLHF